ncbi:MAG: polyribonucleotide nucleotidyltransferase [Parcubacteria group bacterium Greene0714_36]|nr:MAG: polyribonucleotide nucleotidyltransferase [Parcubacteria group bacterium Greene0714_36]
MEGKVTRLLDFGAFVEVGPRQDGLIHISELAPWRVDRVTDILNIGDTTKAVVKNIDEQGRINLSLKDVPGQYSDEEIKRGNAERAAGGGDFPRPHRRPQGGTRFGRPRGR